MILTGSAIVENYKKGHIIIKPFTIENVNPNSYNFRLDKYLKVYNSMPLDPKGKHIYYY